MHHEEETDERLDQFGCSDDPEEAARRTATAAGFTGSVLGAIGGPVGATVGGLVGGTAGYVAGYTTASAKEKMEGQSHSDSVEIDVAEESDTGPAGDDGDDSPTSAGY